MSAVDNHHRQSLRALLVFLAVSAAVPGLWATLAPASFYTSFPLGGPGWVAPLGPPSPHFTADVGAFYLAFAGMFARAAWRPDRALVVPLAVAWMVFSTLHFTWHAFHLEPFDTGNAVAQTASLALVLAAPALVIWLARRERPAVAAPQAPAASHLA